MMKIVILDGYSADPGDLSWEELEQMGELTVYDRTSPSETVQRSAEADIVLTNKVVLDREKIAQLPRLKYIGVLATGYNVVDIEAAHERGIVVTNYWDFPLMELAGKTIGIVGLGNIGRRVAEIALAFGMKVKAVTSKSQEQLPAGIEKADLQTLLSSADVLSLHCPLTANTRHLINADTLRLMKPTAILINTGRGPLIDDQAVANALQKGLLGAFCADVLTTEPPSSNNPLLSQPNAFITPHIAWASTEARTRLLQIAIANVRAFASGKPQNTV